MRRENQLQMAERQRAGDRRLLCHFGIFFYWVTGILLCIFSSCGFVEGFLSLPVTLQWQQRPRNVSK